jgi:hypothetical protein
MNRPARFMTMVPLLSMFTAMSLSAFAEEPRRGEPRAAMHYAHRRFDPHHFDHRLWGRSGARIPTGVGGDAAAIGGGPMAIGISMTTLSMVHRMLFPRSPTMNKAI